jgi:hypothetical protein
MSEIQPLSKFSDTIYKGALLESDMIINLLMDFAVIIAVGSWCMYVNDSPATR